MLTEILCVILSYIFESVRWIQNIFTLDRPLQTFFFQIGLGQMLTFSCFAILCYFFSHQLLWAQHSSPASWQGEKGNLPEVSSPFLMFCSQRDAYCAKGEVARSVLSRFYQVIFVPFQWPELVCCRWQKVGGVSKTLGFEGQELKLCIWALTNQIKSYPETQSRRGGFLLFKETESWRSPPEQFKEH